MMSDPAHVMATIDAAVEDWSAGPDAMRWTPDTPQNNEALASEEAINALRDALTHGPRWHSVPQEESRAAGLAHLVVLTRAAWQDCVAWNTEQDGPLQDETGRLWDVLWMTNCYLSGSSSLIPLLRVPRGYLDWAEPEVTYLVAQVGPGREGDPVITISTIDEEDG